MFRDIKNIETYSPAEVEDSALEEDWRIVFTWWEQLARGREFTYSREQVINVASLIYAEMKRRGMDPGILGKEEYSAMDKELFEIVSEGKVEKNYLEGLSNADNWQSTHPDPKRDLAIINPSGENLGDVIRLDEILPYFKDFYTSKPFIYLVGGLCNHPKKGTTGDIDILIREPKPRGNERLPLLFRLYRMFPPELWPRLQILWSDDDFGPFTNYVPLYNQLIERTRDKEVVLMSREEDDYPEFRKDSEVQLEEEDALRTSKAEIKTAAEESRQRGIKPFRFFEMLKGIAGYRKQEIYSIEGLKDVLKPKDYPYEVDEKYDGMRVQIHKRGDTVKILSIDGENHTKKLKDMVEDLLEWKHDLVLDAEITGWTKSYRKGKHLGRSDVAGFIHARDPIPENVHLFANIFDILYLDGKDLHSQPLADRRVALEKLPNKDSLKIIPMRVAKDWESMKKAVKWASSFPGSEGAMIKSFMSAYPLGGKTAKWIKFKKEADLDAEVVAVHKVRGVETWNYLAVIRSSRGDAVPVGRTYNTSIKAKVGDIIRVAFVNLNMYTDPATQKVWFNWWAPRVIEKRDDKKKPDNDLTARRIHEQTKGESGEKPFPKRYKEVLKVDEINNFLEDHPNIPLEDVTTLFDMTSDEFTELYQISPPTFGDAATVNNVFDANPYLTPADESKKWKFVLHNHFRGKSLHGDLRLERPSFLVGWTLNYQKESKPSEDVDTMGEAKAFAKVHANIKNFSEGRDEARQVIAEKKPPQPLSWLKAEGVYAPGEVGATKEHEGVFHIAASGEVEFGTQKPYYHEYFIHSKEGPYKTWMKGRLVVRLLKNIWGPKAGRGKFVWMAWFAKNQRPYILSKRAVDIGVMPPQGLSWLPRAMRKKVPRQYRYWTMKGKKAKDARDELSELYRKGDIALDQGYPGLPKSGKFTLTEICWRGPIVIRAGCSRTENHIFLRSDGKAVDIILDGNPIRFSKLAAAKGEPKDVKWMNFEGKLPNESVLNPDVKTPAIQKILASGTFKVVKQDGDAALIDFKSKDFSGRYTFMRTRPKTSLFVFKKSE